jgi:hypothetical protein
MKNEYDPKQTVTTDPLVDRDCVILDGSCKCVKPYEDCKYLRKKDHDR